VAAGEVGIPWSLVLPSFLQDEVESAQAEEQGFHLPIIKTRGHQQGVKQGAKQGGETRDDRRRNRSPFELEKKNEKND